MREFRVWKVIERFEMLLRVSTKIHDRVERSAVGIQIGVNVSGVLAIAAKETHATRQLLCREADSPIKNRNGDSRSGSQIIKDPPSEKAGPAEYADFSQGPINDPVRESDAFAQSTFAAAATRRAYVSLPGAGSGRSDVQTSRYSHPSAVWEI